MTDSHPSDASSLSNEPALRKLAWAIAASQGQFALLLARCNYTSLRDSMIERLHQLCPHEIRELTLKASDRRFYTKIREELTDEQPVALMVSGLESVSNLDQMLTAMNQVREEFRKNLPFPLVLWVNDEVLKKLIRLAPDFHNWGTLTEFRSTLSRLTEALKQRKDRLFDAALEVDEKRFSPNDAIFGPRYHQEIKSALEDLHSLGQVLEPELQATLEFALGRDDYVRDEMETALNHYQKSLDFWRQFPDQLGRQGILLFHIGLCHLRQAEAYGKDPVFYWEEARNYFQMAIDRFEQAQQPELVARFINQLGEVLKRLEDWEALSDLAQKSLGLQSTYPNPSRTAQAYGFLAKIALQQSRWEEAKQNAQQSLDLILPTPADQRREQSCYRLLLAQSLQALEQPAEAIAHLEKAREIGSQDNPQLYISVLEALRVLYFQQKTYLEAFWAKQEQRSIEQQYGLRAFIGAGRLKPQRQARSNLGKVERQARVPQEISASGRQQDIKRLLQRIGDTQHRLTVLYGPSGVGKSSVVEAGLIPTLKQTTVGPCDVVPVLLRVYTSWVQELGKALTAALGALPIRINLGNECKSPEAILEQLRADEQHHLLTVLILDQFEEFFFICKTPAKRKRFFEFLRTCLNIPFVKVVLSIREDYLHHLLEGSRRVKLDVINDNILDKDILYYIGNFSPQDAKAIIQSLTQRSQVHLEPELLDALVKDLASDGEEVRPIELQVVGAQLQTETIATLAQYQEHGPKEKLVQRYLAEVVADCGPENQRLAELVLYFLTDENNTRPLKTRSELEKDLEAISVDLLAEANQLDLVLRIFLESGLVFLLPEIPADRYQLVHDYLVVFIRQQEEPKLKELAAELEKERKQRKHSEEQQKRSEEHRKRSEEQLNRVLRQRLRASLATGFGLAILMVLAGRFALRSTFFKKEAEISGIEATVKEISEIAATTAHSEELWAVNQDFNALITSLEALEKLEKLIRNQAPVIDQFTPNQEDRIEELRREAAQGLQKSFYRVSEHNRLEGHEGTVFGVDFSPDGQTLATASADHTVKLWNPNGQHRRTLEGHSDMVLSVNFSPDGQTLATASADHTVKLWNLEGQVLQTLVGHEDTVHSISFSPDGQTIATASEDQTVKLWNLDGQEIQTLTGHSHAVLEVSFSPDGQKIATASYDQTAKLWNLEGQELQTLEGHKDAVFSISFSPDGQMIATGGGRLDKTVKLWNLNGQELQTLEEHNDTVMSVRFSPDGQVIITASADDTVKVWGYDGQYLQTLIGHSSWVWSVGFSPDGETLATASADDTVKLWRLNPHNILGHKDLVHDISFSPNGDTIATVSKDSTVKLWQVDTHAPARYLRSLLGHTGDVRAVNFSPIDPMIATASNDETVKLWNSNNGQKLQTLSGHTDLVVDVNFSPDGQTLATASRDQTAKLWSREGEDLQTLMGHTKEIEAVSFSPNGQTIATASRDRTAKLWDLQGKELATLMGHEKFLTDVTFSPDGQLIATASYDDTAKLWNLEGNELATLSGHKRTVTAVAFSPDGQTLATASWDQTIKLWTRQGEEFDTLYGHTGRVMSLRFSPDGQFLASSDDSGRVILWDLNWELVELRAQGCTWIRDYLENNPKVEGRHRTLCDNVGVQK